LAEHVRGPHRGRRGREGRDPHAERQYDRHEHGARRATVPALHHWSPLAAVLRIYRITFYNSSAVAQGGGMGAAPDDLVARAAERSGLSEFGADGWQEGLEQLVAAVATDLRDNADAVATLEEMIVSRLVHRLRVEQWYAECGDEATAPVQGPLVIVGLPRTATTALHFLLATDPQFRFARPW